MIRYPLHDAARREAAGADVADDVARLLDAGQDPHQADDTGQTAFNVAAAQSPVTGRLMTRHWLYRACQGQGAYGLNDQSGTHRSSLAQYMAKWLTDDEIEPSFTAAIAQGLQPALANDSGWTPLMAAAAMGRLKSVKVLRPYYTRENLQHVSAKTYEACYQGQKVIYAAGLDAKGLAAARLAQNSQVVIDTRRGLREVISFLEKELQP